MVSRISGLEFPDFSAEDRAMIIETMNSMKDTLEAALPRGGEEQEKTDLKMIGAVGRVLMRSYG